MLMAGNRLYKPVPRGENRYAAVITMTEWWHPSRLKELAIARTRNTPLRFTAAYFRRRDDAHAERWDVTDSTGCRVRNGYEPEWGQFNPPHLVDWLSLRKTAPLLKVSFRDAFPDMDDSPSMTHVERMWDVLDLDRALQEGLLTNRRRDAVPDLIALVEHSTGVVIPAASNTRVEFIVGDDPEMIIRTYPIRKGGAGYRSFNGHEKYMDSPDGCGEVETLVDITLWSSELERLIADRDTEAFEGWRRSIQDLKERANNHE